MGTENGHLARMQTLLYGQERFLYGESLHNQWMYSFWYVLRKECAQFWMDTLRALKDRCDFTGDAIDINLIQLCFSNLVQVRQWLHIQWVRGRFSFLNGVPKMVWTLCLPRSLRKSCFSDLTKIGNLIMWSWNLETFSVECWCYWDLQCDTRIGPHPTLTLNTIIWRECMC